MPPRRRSTQSLYHHQSSTDQLDTTFFIRVFHFSLFFSLFVLGRGESVEIIVSFSSGITLHARRWIVIRARDQLDIRLISRVAPYKSKESTWQWRGA
ncbi:hypothetical protein HBI56_011120 [Parastagonospora nodorum]|nr:hypothetical protein HBH56_010630 [Parastagonospora nodorum]QRC90743.1 hypothetical protein JI435_400580 [Parastagonospora nodorum SN15]KAH3934978.1 hypothetical protein HBH54_043930 [Parastagonospora nodorum]KAH3943614.1 hypothetical protein HBH53_169940 [Parastagonospora nodorum]KAH3986792.1 hypothetical protein HBH51_012860 [Parastagonospora nodorum]